MLSRSVSLLACLPLLCPVALCEDRLPGTQPLELGGDLAAAMVEGINRYLTREIESSPGHRATYWKRDFTSHEAYVKSVEPNRKRLKTLIGAVDKRLPPKMKILAGPEETPWIAEALGTNQTPRFKVHQVRWDALEGVDGEGLLLEPESRPLATVIVIPDCDQTPEQATVDIGLSGLSSISTPVLSLAESGARVLIPALLSRRDTWSGNPEIRMTNQPHRELVYRAAYEMGRHLIGLEVQKILAAVDWLKGRADAPGKVGILGSGEGGLIALYMAALDPRIDVAAISGYFQRREELWKEPIYRNVWSLLTEFGDAEIGTLVAPRPLFIQGIPPDSGTPDTTGTLYPHVSGPPRSPGRSGAAPGVLTVPSPASVESEFARMRTLAERLSPPWKAKLITDDPKQPDSKSFQTAFAEELGLKQPSGGGASTRRTRNGIPSEDREKRQLDQLVEFTQRLMRDSPKYREEFWSKADPSSLEAWEETSKWYRDYFWEEVIGKLPDPTVPANPRSRLVYDEPTYRGYEVVLDVYPDVFAYGILLLPKDVSEGEKRPVVVCQHGLEGHPQDVADPKMDSPYYHRFACQLAERGFITFSPQNPYIGEDKFRVLQRKANPLKLSLFSFIVRQHERILEWLSTLPSVDPSRIGFYGLSYGGKTAMRVPAILPEYCLSICSADYNEWIWKNVSFDSRYSYLFTGEYEMPEFNLGNTFNYAELSWLICPRPFMVERGHHDGVAPDEWVAYEFAKTFRRYSLLGIGDRAEIEFFDGPHSIHGVGTFDFLHSRLEWEGKEYLEGH
ncbi:MAG: hypothetical protein GHCLOJNM_04529 [bacterium]|nr:hypothetical protein [bacterium]